VARRFVSVAGLIVLLLGGCSSDEGTRQAVGGIGDTQAQSTQPPAAPEEPPPPPDVASLVEGVLTAEGKQLFYEADPKLLDKVQFDAACPNDSELTVVLGCYNRGAIAILRVDRPELRPIMGVTAAHEMLHAAYVELSARDRNRVDRGLADFYAGLDDPDVRETIARYDRADPQQRPNELHSLLPTEVATLSPALEEYYGRYFTDRARVVAAHEGYAAVFRQLERRVADLHSELDGMTAQLGALEADLGAKEAELESLQAELTTLESQGRVGAYNALVPRQNALADQYNTTVAQFNQLVNSYNRKVDEINALALQQDQLATSLGSKPSIPPA
jgi:hypothetical protein